MGATSSLLKISVNNNELNKLSEPHLQHDDKIILNQDKPNNQDKHMIINNWSSKIFKPNDENNRAHHLSQRSRTHTCSSNFSDDNMNTTTTNGIVKVGGGNGGGFRNRVYSSMDVDDSDLDDDTYRYNIDGLNNSFSPSSSFQFTEALVHTIQTNQNKLLLLRFDIPFLQNASSMEKVILF